MAKRTANIAAQLEAARAELADLETAAPRLAHEAALNGEPEREKYREARAKIDDLREQVAMLESAERHAKHQAEQRERMRKEAERDAIKNRCLKLSLARIELAGKLTEQIAAAVDTYHELQKSTRSIVAAAPIHYPSPPFLMLGVGELRAAANLEVIRTDNRPVEKDSDIAWTFPRSEHGVTLLMKAKPSTIQPMAEVFRSAHNALAIELEKQFFSPPGSVDMAPAVAEAKPAIAEVVVTPAVAGEAPDDTPQPGPEITWLVPLRHLTTGKISTHRIVLDAVENAAANASDNLGATGKAARELAARKAEAAAGDAFAVDSLDGIKIDFSAFEATR